MASKSEDTMCAAFVKSMKQKSTFIGILDSFCDSIEKSLKDKSLDEVAGQDKTLEEIVSLFQSRAKDSTHYFFLPPELRRLLKMTSKFDETLVRNECLAFSEWVIKLNLFLHLQAVETSSSSSEVKRILNSLNDTICGVLELIATNDFPAFTLIVQSYLKLINQIINYISKGNDVSLEISEFSHFIAEVNAVNGSAPKHNIILKLKSTDQIEAVFQSLCKVLIRVKEHLILQLELCENPNLGSQFLPQMLDNAFILKNFKVKVHCLDLYISTIGVETLKHFSNTSFLALLSSCTNTFLKFPEKDTDGLSEAILIRAWYCLLKKLSILDNSMGDPTYMVVDILTFLVRNVCLAQVENWNNDFFQEVIPKVLQDFFKFCIHNSHTATQDLFQHVFKFFEKNSKLIHLTSSWINLIKGVTINQFIITPSQTRTLFSEKSSSLTNSSVSSRTITATPLSSSMEENDDNMTSIGDEEMESDESGYELQEDVEDTKNCFLHHLWQHFSLTTAKSSIDVEDVHVFTILCEVINHRHFSDGIFSIKSNLELPKKISDFAKHCCETIEAYEGNQLTYRICIISNFAKLNFGALVGTEGELDRNLVCSSLLKPWNKSLKSRTIEKEFLVAFDFSLNALVYFDEHLYRTERCKLFLLKCKYVDNDCDLVFEIFPFYWCLLDNDSVAQTLAEIPPRLIPKFIGNCCCIGAGKYEHPIIQCDLFKFLTLSMTCNVCNGTLNEAFVESECLEDELIRKFVLIIENSNNYVSLLFLLNYSAVKFFNHIKKNNVQIIDAFLATFSLTTVEANATVRKIIPQFVKVFSCNDRYESLLLCFKKRFGSESSSKQFVWSEIGQVVEFGAFVEGELLVEVLVYLVRRCWEEKFVKTEIERLARLKKITLSELFIRCHPSLSMKIIDFLIENCSESKRCGNFLLTFTSSFESEIAAPSDQPSKQVIIYVFPYLIMKRTGKSLQLLKSVLGDETDRDDLSHVVTACWVQIIKLMTKDLEPTEIDETLKYIQSLCKTKKLSELFATKSYDIKTFLFRNYHSRRDSVAKLLRELNFYENKANKKTVAKMLTQKQFNDCFINSVRPFFTSFRILINKKVLNSDISEVIEALNSLVDLLEPLRNDSIKAIEVQYKAALRSAFKSWNEHNLNWEKSKSSLFIKSIIDNWKTYIEKHPSLRDQVIEIINDLVPLLPICPELTSQLFKRIIVDRCAEFSYCFTDLHFLPKNIPEMNVVYATIKHHLDKSEADRADLTERLEQIIKNLTSDNPEVKIRHLQQLRVLLQKNRDYLQKLRVPRKDESSDYIVQKLLKTLMASCMPYDNLHLIVAECLGEVGAIDPGRLDLVNCKNIKRKIISFSVNDPNFGVMLITELSSILDDKAESGIHDCVYYAIQEVLKIYRVNHAMLKNKQTHWFSLNEAVKKICESLLTSLYDVKNDFSSAVQSPIYNTELNYKEWIFQWMVKLITLIPLDCIERRLFTACLPTVKHSCSFARFLLPFALLYALKEADECNRNTWIIGEIKAITRLSAGLGNESSTFPYPLTSPMETKLAISTTYLVEVQHLCVQTIFSVLDSLDSWADFIKHSVKRTRSETSFRSQESHKTLTAVKLLFKELLKTDLSDLAFSCQAYARALRYMEKHMRKNIANMSHWASLQKYYAALDDADGVEGVISKMTYTPSLKDVILAHEVKGQFQDVLSCCEKGIKEEPANIDYFKIQIRCLMNLDSPSTASNVALGCISCNENWKVDLMPYVVEASWKLSSWDDLDRYLKNDICRNPEATFNVGIGKLFNFAINKNLAFFEETLKQLRQKEMNPIAAATMESGAYIRGYPHLVRLHILNDVEYGLRQLFIAREQRDLKGILQEWYNRNSVVQPSLRFLEPIINLQRIIVPLNNDNMYQCIQESAKSLLMSAKIARKSGHLQRAYNCILEAENGVASHEIPISLRSQLIIERSKYLWAKGEQESAITYLEKELSAHFSDIHQRHSQDAERAFMKVKLLSATYADQTSRRQSNDMIELYTEVSRYSSDWEEPHFRLAKYYDKLLPTMRDDESQKASTMVNIIKSFRDSLKYGAKHVNESVPRMLTVWFDLGSLCSKVEKTEKGIHPYVQHYNIVSNEVIDSLLSETPTYYYMTCFTQLLSRICHPYSHIRKSLRKLISALLADYPKQAFWMLLGTYNNSVSSGGALRRVECNIILEMAEKIRKQKPCLSKYIKTTLELSNFFIDLAKAEKENVDPIAAKITKLLKSANDSKFDIQFLLPYQRFMNVRLPSKFHCKNRDKHKPFADPVYIVGMSETIQIFHTLQKPKKITLIGSDGERYVMLCKANDDLRKDQRTMEFMNLVNFHLKKDPETRKRQLSIRTYAVVPLSDSCGLLEWVDDLKGIREIIQNLYPHKGGEINEFRALFTNQPPRPVDERITKFKQVMKNVFEPPVLSKFFLRNFNDPTAWYLARLAYVRSCAVMSIVGFIIGLGDRHLENILINVVTGNLVHVDFNVLFNKGLTLPYPELVPFRLTHNLVDAMGATGYEGAFRITCETTLRVMREQIDALMSVLKPFVYDPLLEGKEKVKHRKDDTYEVIPEEALQSVNDIENRIKGYTKNNGKQIGRTPLSVSGHVSYLIEEATNVRNLGAMYVGWAPYY